MSTERRARRIGCIGRAAQAGITLIELVMFIVIVSVGIAGVLSVMDVASRSSADPMLRKQALSVAEALMEEVLLMPFSDCDPDFYAPGSCGQAEAMGPETGEARGGASPFDNVNDYNGFNLATGASEIGGSGQVTVPAGFSAQVAVTADNAFGPTALGAGQALRVRVTVTYNGPDTIVLEGYRTRYAPEAMP